jgi:hypothetical protein
MTDEIEEFDNVMFMTQTVIRNHDDGFYVAFGACLGIGLDPDGKQGIVIEFIDGQGKSRCKFYPAEAITQWNIKKTMSRRQNHRGVRLRVVVPLPPLPGSADGNFRPWLLTFKVEGWDNYYRMIDACTRYGFPGNGRTDLQY